MEAVLAFRDKIRMRLQSVPLLSRENRQDGGDNKTVGRKDKDHTKQDRRQIKTKHALPGKASKPLETKKGPTKPQETDTILFNKLSFKETTAGSTKKGSRGPKQALASLEKRQQKLATLEESDATRAAALKEKDSWAKAIERAQGTSIRDDPRLLKRSIARREKQKEKAKDRWEERQAKIKEGKMAKQEKRQENINSRKDSKKGKGKKGSKKKGRK